MVSKISQYGRPYEILDGKRLVWHPENDEGVRGGPEDVVIPMRLKLRTILDMASQDVDDTQVMVDLLTKIAPGQMDKMSEMDINDFQDMFITWQSEYNSLNGGSLGEPSQSAPSSPPIVDPSSTTSVSVSTYP